jgi:hypothetical protein
LTFHPPLALADFPDRKTLAQAADDAVRAGLPTLGSVPPDGVTAVSKDAYA